MSFALVSVITSLALILALNWQRLNALGAPTVTRWLAIWTAIIGGVFLLVRWLGY